MSHQVAVTDVTGEGNLSRFQSKTVSDASEADTLEVFDYSTILTTMGTFELGAGYYDGLGVCECVGVPSHLHLNG